MNGNHSNDNNSNSSGKNVGILGVEVYIPSTYIKQSSLEEYNGVSSGKYTIGLGQECMSVIHGDVEDINSICLTVVQSLLEKYKIDPKEVGRLEVGTETLVDKSKSTKTVLMDLFKSNHDIEGATIVNACYGGTAALLNAFLWVESGGWDGRYAIVVAGDIAAYERGAARPTSGAGAVAVLVGRDACLVFDGRSKASYAGNVWDFYKPDGGSEYPVVDGVLSQTCYYEALEECYKNYTTKVEKNSPQATKFHAETFDYWIFHSPYNKLVQKSYGRLFLLDARRDPAQSDTAIIANEYLEKAIGETYSDKVLEGVLKKASANGWTQRLTDANAASKVVGNTYTASVFFGIASLIDRKGDELVNRTIGLFSYGSGAIATLYSLTVRKPSNPKYSVGNIQKTMGLGKRLDEREEVHPSELDHALDTRARMQEAGAPYAPVYPHDRLCPGTYYLTSIDEKWKRHYARIPLDAEVQHDTLKSVAPPSVVNMAKGATGKLSAVTEANRRVACVITGISAGLPGQSPVFHKDNLSKLIQGENCITLIPPSGVQHLLEKNVVQLQKCPDGTVKRIPVQTEHDMISVAAQLAPLHLADTYGIPQGLVDTMDVAAQVAVAAGLEAMKDAGLISGTSPNSSEWKLPEELRDSTGIVYASSFPAMDAAVAEVMRFLHSKSISNMDTRTMLELLKRRFVNSNGGCISEEDDAAFEKLLSSSKDHESPDVQPYEFNRKFLFKVLVLANAQLAQLTGARGPNTQTNAACAGTTQAIAMAQDMLISGRAQRVIVIAGDNASGSTLLPWLGAGFRALGAASTANTVEDSALPFDLRRNGMILGAGAIGMVLETEQSSISRLPSSSIKARLLQTQYSNSAYHGASMDRHHIASELNRFLTEVQVLHGIPRADIAQHGVYLSHETSTHASPSTSCSSNETAALRTVFGSTLLSKLLICNTKGFTGHPMGVSFEDVVAVQILISQCVPPIPNYKVRDPYLGDDLNLCTEGGEYGCRYALRFSAGFGSQVAFALYEVF